MPENIKTYLFITTKEQKSMTHFYKPVNIGTISKVCEIPKNSIIQIIPDTQNKFHHNIHQALIIKYGENGNIDSNSIFYVDINFLIVI